MPPVLTVRRLRVISSAAMMDRCRYPPAGIRRGYWAWSWQGRNYPPRLRYTERRYLPEYRKCCSRLPTPTEGRESNGDEGADRGDRHRLVGDVRAPAQPRHPPGRRVGRGG